VVREVSATASGSIAGLLYPPASAAILIYTCPSSTQQLGVTPEIAQRERYTVHGSSDGQFVTNKTIIRYSIKPIFKIVISAVIDVISVVNHVI